MISTDCDRFRLLSKYALAAALALGISSSVLAEETPANTAIVPVPKLENDSYDWYARHEEVLKIKQQINPEIVMIGDSITHFWGGPPESPNKRGPQAWQKLFGQRRVLNLGFGWDRTQNVLWRLAHGEFDGLSPRYVVINIGTNNFTGTYHARENSPAEVAEGIRAICDCIHAKSPKSRIILMGVLPRGPNPNDPFRIKIPALNKLLAEYGKTAGITVLDIGQKFLQPDGKLPQTLMSDFCHPTEEGYAIWASALKPLLQDTETAPDAKVKPRAAKPTQRKLADLVMAPIEDVPGLPRVLLIGDSVSIGYTLPVRELLKGKANVHRPNTNCNDTNHGLADLDHWLGSGKWDVIHFNFGLHDLKYLDGKGKMTTPDKGKQVNPLPHYETNLRALAARLKKTGAKIIWCSTTPVPEGAEGRVKDSEIEYNAVAAKVAAEFGFAVDDLHSVAKESQATIQLRHNVHFTPAGSKVLAKAVATSIETALGK